MFPRTLTTLLLSLGLTFGSFTIATPDAAAQPGSILAKSREKGPRTHKGRATTSKGSSKTKSSSSKSSNRSSSTRARTSSSSERRVVRTTTTRSTPTRTNVQSRRTVTRTRPAAHHTTTTRTVRNARPRTTTTHHRGHSVRRTYYSGSRHTHTSHHHSHHTHAHTSSRSYVSSSSRSGRTHGRATIEPYVTGGLGISGLAADAIVDGALPGVGYNLAVGAKGKLFGAEFGVNGGGYTLTPGDFSTDLGIIGLSGDLKLQPSIAFFEPYLAVGVGGYALQDAVIAETSGGVGVRLGAGADFRFDNIALRAGYQFGGYGFGNESGAYGAQSIGAKSETLSASLVVYF